MPIEIVAGLDIELLHDPKMVIVIIKKKWGAPTSSIWSFGKDDYYDDQLKAKEILNKIKELVWG